MKYHEKQRWKKRMAGIIAIVLALAMVLSLVAPFLAYAAPMAETVEWEEDEEQESHIAKASELGQERFELEAEVGFGGGYIVGKTAPLRGVITNKGEDFRGELQVKTYTYEAELANGTASEYAVYYQNLELAQGASKKIEMEVNLNLLRRFLQVTLVDQQGKTVFLQNLDLKAQSPKTCLIGVLGENPKELQGLSTMKDSQAESGEEALYRTVFLTEETFPDSRSLMESFRILILDDFDTKALREEQKSALYEWLRQGGMLFLGTGISAEKALNGLDFTKETLLQGMEERTSLPLPDGGRLDFSDTTPLRLAKLENPKLETLWQQDGTTFAYLLREGDGEIILPAFSLSAAPMANRGETSGLLWELGRRADEEWLKIAEDEDPSFIQDMSGGFPALNSRQIMALLALVGVYVVIVGPLTYLVLKKKDKREKGWIVIPAVSVFFMAAMLLLSFYSPYRSGMLRMVSFVEMEEGETVADAAMDMSLKHADKGEVLYTNEEKLEIFPQNTPWRYYGNINGDKTRCNYKLLSGEETEITFYDNESWSTNSFQAKKTMDLGGNVAAAVYMENDRLKGDIINHTNVNFTDVFLNLGNTWHKIDSLRAGETVHVDLDAKQGEDEMTSFGDLFYSYDYGALQEAVADGSMTREEAFRLRSEEDMLQRSMNSYEGNSGRAVQIAFYGFSEEPILESVGKINGKTPTVSALNLYHQIFSVNLAELKSFDIPFTVLPEQVDAGIAFEWNDKQSIMPIENGELNLVYRIGEHLDIELLQFRDDMDPSAYLEAPMIFNRSTQAWEPLKETEYTKAADYISAENEVHLRLFAKEYQDIYLPSMRMKGSGQLAGN